MVWASWWSSYPCLCSSWCNFSAICKRYFSSTWVNYFIKLVTGRMAAFHTNQSGSILMWLELYQSSDPNMFGLCNTEALIKGSLWRCIKKPFISLQNSAWVKSHSLYRERKIFQWWSPGQGEDTWYQEGFCTYRCWVSSPETEIHNGTSCYNLKMCLAEAGFSQQLQSSTGKSQEQFSPSSSPVPSRVLSSPVSTKRPSVSYRTRTWKLFSLL